MNLGRGLRGTRGRGSSSEIDYNRILSHAVLILLVRHVGRSGGASIVQLEIEGLKARGISWGCDCVLKSRVCSVLRVVEMKTRRCRMLRQAAVMARGSGLAVIEMQTSSGRLSGQVKVENSSVCLQRGNLPVWDSTVLRTVTCVPLAEVER